MSDVFNALVYPLKGSIRFEVDDIRNFSSDRYSESVRIGSTEWFMESHPSLSYYNYICRRLQVKTECSERTGNEKYFGVFLACFSTPGKEKRVETERTVRLINQNDISRNKEVKSNKDYDENGQSFGSVKFVKWSELLSDGFVEDDTIIVEYDITVESEGGVKRRNIDFEQERPNEQDLKSISKAKMFPKVEKFEEEIDVSRITESFHYTDPITVFGLPVMLSVQKVNRKKEDYLAAYLYVNWEDTSEWWRSKTAFEIRAVSQYPTKTKGNALTHLYSKTASNRGWAEFMKWQELVYSTNGYVKDEKIKIEVTVQVLEAYGFDDKTRRGINKPMRKMTDAVLNVDGKTLHVSQSILAQQSSYFKDIFSSNPGKKSFEIGSVKLEDLVRFLELIHNVDTDVCEENAEEVLKLIERFKAPECFERLDMILKKLTWKDAMKVLELVDKYPLPELRRKFLLKLKDEELLKSITHSPRYKKLSDSMKVAILEWKVIPEESRTEDIERSDYEFSTDFEEQTDQTDIKIEVNGYTYHASKLILANASIFFMKRFYGPDSDDTPKISIFDVLPREFEKLLTHIYHPTRPVTSANLPSLLRLAHQFSVPRLMDKCEEYLVLNDTIEMVDKLEYAGKYDLPYLLSACCNTLEKSPEKLKEVKTHCKFMHLSPKVHSEFAKRKLIS